MMGMPLRYFDLADQESCLCPRCRQELCLAITGQETDFLENLSPCGNRQWPRRITQRT